MLKNRRTKLKSELGIVCPNPSSSHLQYWMKGFFVTLACLLPDKDKQHVAVQGPGRRWGALGVWLEGLRVCYCPAALPTLAGSWDQAGRWRGSALPGHVFKRVQSCLRESLCGDQAARVGVLEGECCSAGPLSDWRKGAESAAGFED